MKTKKKVSKTCRNMLASKIRGSCKTSHVCTIRKNLALGIQTRPNPKNEVTSYLIQ